MDVEIVHMRKQKIFGTASIASIFAMNGKTLAIHSLVLVVYWLPIGLPCIRPHQHLLNHCRHIAARVRILWNVIFYGIANRVLGRGHSYAWLIFRFVLIFLISMPTIERPFTHPHSIPSTRISIICNIMYEAYNTLHTQTASDFGHIAHIYSMLLC